MNSNLKSEIQIIVGGPLTLSVYDEQNVKQQVQIGVVSFGSARGCVVEAREYDILRKNSIFLFIIFSLADGYARTTSFIDWIDDEVSRMPRIQT